jgi:hypothetical protein
MDPLLSHLATLLRGLWVALLPAPERPRFAREHYLDAPRWSAAFGFVQGGIGVALFVVLGIAFMRGVSGDLSQGLLENWEPGLEDTHFRATGLIGWLTWLVWPGSWPWSYLGVVGLVRIAAFAVTREAVGEPLFILALRGWQRIEGRRRARREEIELGPRRTDRVHRDGEDLVIVSRGAKPGWDEAATIEIADRYYRIVDSVERRDGEWKSTVYRLREIDPTVAIRRLERYVLPRSFDAVETGAEGGARRE